ncbi:MAG TPA: hypothetical protein VG818_05585, partial [Gemmatimonadaceae bacterium]|nr:hypothetical protein [Gemmatimonadaceae bacterium]
MSTGARIRMGVVLAAAFVGGLIVASGFNLTRLSWAEVVKPSLLRGSPELNTGPAPVPPPSVKSADDFSAAFEWASNVVRPAVVSIQ